MHHRVIPVTVFSQNCTLIWCEKTHHAALIDPGGEADLLLEIISQSGLTLERILLTHGHLDHVGAAGDIAARCGVPIEGPQREDLFWLEALEEQARMFGLERPTPFTPTRWLEDGDEVRVGELRLEVLHTPGHTPGHVVFYHPASHWAQVGDVLFQGGIGRSDFPRGDHATLLRSIRERLLVLGDEVSFVPGHGPSSSFGAERRHNPFLRD